MGLYHYTWFCMRIEEQMRKGRGNEEREDRRERERGNREKEEDGKRKEEPRDQEKVDRKERGKDQKASPSGPSGDDRSSETCHVGVQKPESEIRRRVVYYI